MIVVNGQLVAQGSQFSMADVEVITARIDLDEVRTYRGSLNSLGVQAAHSPSYPRVDLDVDVAVDREGECILECVTVAAPAAGRLPLGQGGEAKNAQPSARRERIPERIPRRQKRASLAAWCCSHAHVCSLTATGSRRCPSRKRSTPRKRKLRSAPPAGCGTTCAALGWYVRGPASETSRRRRDAWLGRAAAPLQPTVASGPAHLSARAASFYP